MRVFGVVITTRRKIMEHQIQAGMLAALADPEHPLRQAVVRAARGAAKDHVSDWFEAERERFEQLPMFEDFARQQREHDLAEAENAQPAELKPSQLFDFNESQLRYGILGMLVEHGMQYTATIADAFSDWTPAQITHVLSELVSAGLVEVNRGAYTATLAGVGLGSEQKEARNEDPDPQ